MSVKFENLFRAVYALPNGLQVTDQGVLVADQVTDRVALMEIAVPDRFGATQLLSEVVTESSNTSGLATGGGALWLGANGPGARRSPRPTDANQGTVIRADPKTGETLERWKLPVDGGTHGLEYDSFEEDVLWVTSTSDQTLLKMRISDWSVLKTLDLPYTRPHGVVRVEDGLWVIHTSDRVIVKLDFDGGELARIEVPEPHPEPHGLSIIEGGLLYCDATTGWITKVETEV